MAASEISVTLLAHLSVAFEYISSSFEIINMDGVAPDIYSSVGNVQLEEVALKQYFSKEWNKAGRRHKDCNILFHDWLMYYCPEMWRPMGYIDLLKPGSVLFPRADDVAFLRKMQP